MQSPGAPDEDDVCIKSFDEFVLALEENVDLGKSAITMNVKPSTASKSDRVRDEPQKRNVTEISSETSSKETSGAPGSDAQRICKKEREVYQRIP